MSFRDKILFIEDVSEYYYSIDRLLWHLKRAGKLSELKGLIVGGFTDLKNNAIPFGETIHEIIMIHVKEYDYPVAFDFPAGHIPDNHALVFGRETKIDVSESDVSLRLSNYFTLNSKVYLPACPWLVIPWITPRYVPGRSEV